MIRFSSINRLVAQSRYILNHKKPPTQIPTSKPPKYVASYQYLPNADPGVDMGFPQHRHLNKFVELGGYKYEDYRYSYVGQWWEQQGNFVGKLVVFFSPAIVGLILASYMYKNQKSPMPNSANIRIQDRIYNVGGSNLNMR